MLFQLILAGFFLALTLMPGLLSRRLTVRNQSTFAFTTQAKRSCCSCAAERRRKVPLANGAGHQRHAGLGRVSAVLFLGAPPAQRYDGR